MTSPFGPAADRAQRDKDAYFGLIARHSATLYAAAEHNDVDAVFQVLADLYSSLSTPMTGAADITHHLLVAAHEDAPAHLRTPTGAFDLNRVVSSDQPDALAVIDIAARLGETSLTRAEEHLVEAQQALDACQEALAHLASDGDEITRKHTAVTTIWTLRDHPHAAAVALLYAWAALRAMHQPTPPAHTPG
ncbi:hypothetical protein [Streptomyces botrytidirepellens]|uniref:Uncharacterized protein n=1 Tax=Streptomyces botrytidirepellens TaxID=2486417 RepID=A0A3M8X784_9ACTN|nr:hypothetical protein [Streptomyces botrytidirepellens]RNG37987.1 hypothetical protein EEJ42_02040 [Streptomyces botrytidirepellens]